MHRAAKVAASLHSIRPFEKQFGFYQITYSWNKLLDISLSYCIVSDCFGNHLAAFG